MKRNNLKDFFEGRLEIKQMGKVLGGALPERPDPKEDETPDRTGG
jgi:hypothetical protein